MTTDLHLMPKFRKHGAVPPLYYTPSLRIKGQPSTVTADESDRFIQRAPANCLKELNNSYNTTSTACGIVPSGMYPTSWRQSMFLTPWVACGISNRRLPSCWAYLQFLMEQRTLRLLLWSSSLCIRGEYNISLRKCIK